MLEANGPIFDENSHLDLLGGGSSKVLSQSPKATSVGNPLLPVAASKKIGDPLSGADLLPAKQSNNSGGPSSSKPNGTKDTGKPPADQIGSQESDSFYKMYNKEIKVNQDEIPIILAELTDAAFNFIQRENYEKALILLQKTEGVLEVVSLEGCSRDRYVSFITYNNMSMCFQKLGMLDECIFYLKQSIALVSDPKFYKTKRISVRNKRVNHECKLKLQLCAILSQNQNHSEALENARKSVRLSHQMFKDMEELCQLYIDKINYKDNLLAAQEQSDLEDAERVQLISMVMDSSPAKEIPKNFLEQSISLVERSSLKMFPVIREVRRRVVNSEVAPAPEEGEKQKKQRNSNESLKSFEKQIVDEDDDLEEEKPDMRSVLGFLNQNEWIYNLNIGNIMQIQPISMKEFLNESSDELELSRESFLSKLSVLIVTYFCMSTEMRFLLQSRANYLKPEVKRDRELESEFWHAKALEIACTFLPSECPLLNHVLLSYQKHHDPTMQPIKEDEESNDVLSVLRPLKGIEQSKYQPIVRTLPQVKISMSPQGGHVPLKEVLKQYDLELVDQVINFNKTKVRRINEIVDKEVQVVDPTAPPYINRDSPTQANLSAIAIPNQRVDGFQDGIGLSDHHHHHNGVMMPSDMIGVVENSNILPLSLNESRVASDPISQNSNQTSTQKLKKEMYLQEQSMLEDRDFGNNDASSIEGLEQQLLNVVDSPSRQNPALQGVNKFPFDSRDDFFPNGFDSYTDEDGENKLYDVIISKVLSNPKIDKKTLLQKFISKIEMESNMGLGLSDELSQIKKMLDAAGNGTSIDSVELIDDTKHHAVSHVDQVNGLLDDEGVHNNGGSHSMQQIRATGVSGIAEEQDSEIMLNVPQEVMNGQMGVQNARVTRVDNQRVGRHNKAREAKGGQSAKTVAQGGAATSSKDQHKSRIDTSVRTRSSSHHMKGSNKRHMGGHGGDKKSSQTKGTEQKDFRKVKSYLEDESLFKDIERSTEYQDPLNLNIMGEQSENNNTDTQAVDVDEIQFEQKSSQKSQSRSNSRKKGPQHHSSIQSSTEQQHRHHSSNKKNNTSFSRPQSGVNRPSSVNLRRGRRRQANGGNVVNQHQSGSGNPQKTLIAKELDDTVAARSRSESSSRGRFQRYQTRYQQNRTQESIKEAVPVTNNTNITSGQTNLNQNARNSNRLRHSQARKRLSVNHHSLNQAHVQSVEHHAAEPNKMETKNFNQQNGGKSSKRLGGAGGGGGPSNKHHNLSVQAAPPQHGLTSKIKKLVSHKQIETNIKRNSKHSKQKLSQTKNILQQNKMSTVCNSGAQHVHNQHASHQQPTQSRGRSTKLGKRNNSKSKSRSKSKSISRSSGKRTYSGSSRHIKSRSQARSSSDNRRNMQNELAQYSFDMVGDDQVNINATSAQQLIAQHSKTNLARQVLENQKTILGLLSKQRADSGDSRKSRSQNRKKSSFTAMNGGNIDNLMPKKQHTSTHGKIQRLSTNHNLSQAQILLQAHALPQNQQLGGNGGSHGGVVNPDIELVGSRMANGAGVKNQGMQNSASQHVKGLSNFIKQITSQKQTDQQMNKSLQYLKKQQKSSSMNKSQPPRPKANQKKNQQQQQQQAAAQQHDQGKFKQNLMNEIRSLQHRLQEHLQQANEASPIRKKSGSQKRSDGNRSVSRSRSRSPTQPTKALIPKKKSFNALMNQSKNMNLTTSEVAQLNESLLNMSNGDVVKPSRAHHATSKLAKRKLENLIQHQQIHNASGIGKKSDNNNNLAYNSFEEGIEGNQLAHSGQSNTHHSLSMFDNEVSSNQVLAPLHHQLSQNAILAPKPLSQSFATVGGVRDNNQRPSSKLQQQSKQAKQSAKRSSQNPTAERRLQANQSQTANYRTAAAHPQVLAKSSKLLKNNF